MSVAGTSAAHSLRMKLLLPLLALLAAIALVTVWALHNYTRREQVEQLRLRAELVANAVNYAAESISRPGELQRVVTAMGAEPGVNLIVVVGGHPTRVLASTRIAWLGLILADLPAQGLAESLEAAIQDRDDLHLEADELTFSARFLLSQSALTRGSLTDGAVTVHLDSRPTRVAIWRATLGISSAFLAVGALLSVVGYRLLLGRVLNPLAAIAARVTRQRDGTRGVWPETARRDEIGTFARLLQNSLERAESSFHELATQKAALAESHRLLQAIIDNVPARIFWKDRDSRYLGCNPAYARDAGEARSEDVVGKDDFQLALWSRQAEAYRAEDRQVLETGAPLLSYEERIATADGSEIWIRASKLPLRDEQGDVLGLLGVYEDVSERKRVEEALQASEEEHRALIEHMADGLVVADRADEIRFVSPPLCRMLGYSAAELLGQSVNTLLVHEEDVVAMAERTRRRLEGTAEGYEVRLRRRSGELLWTWFSATPMRDREGRITGSMAIVSDITARRQTEQMLLQSQRIEGIGRLAGGVAHDFNNILGVILGYGELAEAGLAPGSPVREQVAEMVKAAQRAATLTRQLQAFSRKQILQPKRLDLNDLVGNAHRLLERLIGEDIALVVRLEPGLATMRADPGQIDQILLNLAVNARDAMPTGGTLTVETANADLYDHHYIQRHPPMRPGRYVRLAVSDTGVGMDAETQRQIFEPFFTTKPAGQGTGLGLSTVYGIVKQSDGFIWVYSEPGHGTTFKIYFPRVDEPPDGNPRSAPLAIARGGRETVLLVEDNPALREVTRQRLEESGYTVLLAGDGAEALALAGARPEAIDLLLTDVVMPKVGGVELAQRLTASRPGLPVLFMSGYTDSAIAQHGVLTAGVALLEKPFNGERLVRAVRAALDRSSPG